MKTSAPGLSLVVALLAPGAGCALSSHATEPSALGKASSSAALLGMIDAPGPVVAETVVACDWQIDRGGLLNLDHPRAEAAGLEDGLEPGQIYFHVLRHPSRGTFLIDTGVEKALRDAPDDAAIRGIVAGAMKVDKMKFVTPLGDWVARERAPIRGVFLTHLHVDHVSGMPDVPAATPVYAGPGETGVRAFQNLVLQSTIDRLLEGKGPIHEWRYAADPQGRFAGVLDIFGDGSVFALHVPGHTPGSTAYLARTPRGPVLFVGDACHTRWGWDNGVEPGTYSEDRPLSAVSLAALRRLAAEHPGLEVRLGHQR